MKFIIFDTETTGLFDFKQPADAPGQPRLAQFGAILLDAIDAEPRRIGMLIEPDGWEMSPGAEAVNGLSTEYLRANGQPVEEALTTYVNAIEAGYVAVAFNAQFDTKVMRAELRRAGRDDMFERTPNICVMRALTDILQIPSKRGPAWGYKYPNLAEACAYFGIANAKAHDAMGDADAAMAILLKLHAMGALPAPAVHYAKERA